jgi:hypothetical protein
MLGMRWTLAVSIALLFSPAAVGQQSSVPHSHGGFAGMSGNDLLPLCQAAVEMADGKTLTTNRMIDATHCDWYIDGVLDGFHFRDSDPNIMQTICFPDGVNGEQMTRIVLKFLQDHPARLHDPAYALIFAATLDAFECSAPSRPTASHP